MRLVPVERPKGILLNVAFYVSRREFGKVLSIFKTIYARSAAVLGATTKLLTTEKKLTLTKEVKQLILFYTSHLNDCKFCSNVNEFTAARQQVKLHEWKEFLNFRNSDRFSEKERALLAYLEEVNLTKSATDKTFNELSNYFNEVEIVEITWLNAVENYFNLMAKPLKIPSDELVPEISNVWNENNFFH